MRNKFRKKDLTVWVVSLLFAIPGFIAVSAWLEKSRDANLSSEQTHSAAIRKNDLIIPVQDTALKTGGVSSLTDTVPESNDKTESAELPVLIAHNTDINDPNTLIVSIEQSVQNVPQAAEPNLEHHESVMDKLFAALNQRSIQAKSVPGDANDILFIVVDSRATLKDRCKAAKILAGRDNPPYVTDTLLLLIDDSTVPEKVRSALAEGFGSSPYPAKQQFLLNLVDTSGSEEMIRGALRGLAAAADNRAMETMAQIIDSSEYPGNTRSYAAIALGRVSNPKAGEILMQAYDNTSPQDADVKKEVLRALSGQPLSETSEFLRSVYTENAANPQLRTAVMEVVEEASGEVPSFVMDGLHDPDAEVRSAAAWALAASENPPAVAPDLLTVIAQEQDAGVRTYLYQAVANQSHVDTAGVITLLGTEQDSGVRMSGYEVLARNAKVSNQATVQYFDTSAVPELESLALTSARLNVKLKAVTVLLTAKTPTAIQSLQNIAAATDSPAVVKAIRSQIKN